LIAESEAEAAAGLLVSQGNQCLVGQPRGGQTAPDAVTRQNSAL